jgi:hypothetical protein
MAAGRRCYNVGFAVNRSGPCRKKATSEPLGAEILLAVAAAIGYPP